MILPVLHLFTELTVQNVLDVLREVQYSSAYWRELGRRLKPDLDLDAIEANHARVEARLEAVIGRWCRDGEGATWEGLAQVVCQCRSGGGKNVAEKIRQKTRRSTLINSLPIRPQLE